MGSDKVEVSIEDMLGEAVRLWVRGSPKKMWRLWRLRRGLIRADVRRQRLLEREKLTVPPVIIFSPTMRCNFSCYGCYSRGYPQDGEISPQTIDRLLTDAEDLGTFIFVVTGGEPFLRSELIDLYEKHSRVLFVVFNNGSLMDAATARRLARCGNVVPVLSVEGNPDQTDVRRGSGAYERVLEAMAHLRKADVFFGFSVMVSRRNVATVSDVGFVDAMIERGCRIGFYVEYIPVGDQADPSLVPSAKERIHLREQVLRFRQEKPIILFQLPDDEYENGRCGAAGTAFLHVTARGDVEPCPFAHYAWDNVQDRPLRGILRSSFFDAIRTHPFLLHRERFGCALLDHKEELRRIAHCTGARATDGSSIH